MDIKQCRYFIAIAEEKQITAAARRLHMAQPPLSQQLKLMEEELGVILFERKGRMMELTQAGRSFYDYAVTLTKYMEEAVMEMQSFRHGIRGKLAIGINTISDRLIPQALQQFRTTHPQVTYKIQQNESAQLCRLLEDGKVELACVRMPVQTERYEVLHLPQEPLFYISSTPLDSPTEMGPGVEMGTYFEQLTGIPLLLPSTEGLGMFELILDKFREHQVTPSIMGECSDINMLLEPGPTRLRQFHRASHGTTAISRAPIPRISYPGSAFHGWLGAGLVAEPLSVQACTTLCTTGSGNASRGVKGYKQKTAALPDYIPVKLLFHFMVKL